VTSFKSVTEHCTCGTIYITFNFDVLHVSRTGVITFKLKTWGKHCN